MPVILDRGEITQTNANSRLCVLRRWKAIWFLNGGRCWGTLWVTPHSREVVLQMFKYDGYAKDKDGNFTQSKFVEVSNKVGYTI